MAKTAAKTKTLAPTITPTVKLINRLMGRDRYIGPCVYNLEIPLPDYPAADYGYDEESMSMVEVDI
jgi:hypothetical protein